MSDKLSFRENKGKNKNNRPAPRQAGHRGTLGFVSIRSRCQCQSSKVAHYTGKM